MSNALSETPNVMVRLKYYPSGGNGAYSDRRSFYARAEALLTLDDSLENERTAPTSVGDGSLFPMAEKSNIATI